MIVAVIGSRGITVDNLEDYLPEDVTEIVTGGARGVDSCAEKYARAHHIQLTVFRPEYSQYKKAAPLVRNIQIIQRADLVLAFWDGTSRGTKFVIDRCLKMHTPVRVFRLRKNSAE